MTSAAMFSYVTLSQKLNRSGSTLTVLKWDDTQRLGDATTSSNIMSVSSPYHDGVSMIIYPLPLGEKPIFDSYWILRQLLASALQTSFELVDSSKLVLLTLAMVGVIEEVSVNWLINSPLQLQSEQTLKQMNGILQADHGILILYNLNQRSLFAAISGFASNPKLIFKL